MTAWQIKSRWSNVQVSGAHNTSMYETHFFLSTDSTNRLAFEFAEKGAGHGTAVIAESQVNGRGRLGRIWHSPPKKGLYCSIIVRPNLALHEYPKITLAAGLAVSNALDRICACASLVKWPNDIYLRERKVGGILTESSLNRLEAGGHFAVIGIGLNINSERSDFPVEILHKATSVLLETGRQNVLHEVFQAIRTELLQEITVFEKNGFDDILRRWQEKDALKDRYVRWVTHAGMLVCGRSKGPDATGRLIIQDDSGQYHEVLSGDVLLAGCGEESEKTEDLDCKVRAPLQPRS